MVGRNDSATIIEIEGKNFIDNEDQVETVTLVSRQGLEIPLEIISVTATMIDALVPGETPEGIYDIRAILVDRFNSQSSVQLQVYQPESRIRRTL